MNTIPVTLFRDLPVYSGSLPADGIQVVAVENNTNTYRVPLESLTGSMAEVATRIPEAAGDDVHGNLAWEDGALYVNTSSGWQKTALYSQDYWADIVPGTRFLRVDAVMTTLSPAEVQNVFKSLGIDEATSTNKGLVYVASSLEDSDLKVATVGLVKECVSSTSERMEELYVDMQGMVEHVDAAKLSVDGSLVTVLEAKEDITNARTYVTAAESRIAGLDVHVALNADRAELAAQRAEEAAADFPGFDEVPVAGSVKAVKSGGIKEWGDANFLSVAHASDIEEENYTIHVSQEDRERWDSYSDAGISPEERAALDNLVNGDIISGNVRIGVDAGETVLWIRKSGDGTNDLSVTADEVAVTAAGGLSIAGSATVSGGVAVTGLLTAGGDPVVTTGDAGAFPSSSSEKVDGYATVQDAIAYIGTVRTSIIEQIDDRYLPTDTGLFARLDGDNTMTGHNVFTGEVNLQGPVTVEGSALLCIDGISVVGGGVDVGTGGYVNAPEADIGALHTDLVDIGTGGSLRVDGDTNLAGLTVGGDARVMGAATVDGTLDVGNDLSIGGVTTFGDIVDSDVIIGHGPLGQVQAQADLHIGDPSAAGTMRYNDFTYSVDEEPATQATGQVALVDPMIPCMITIGDNDPLYIEPERANLVTSRPAPALLASSSTYASLESGASAAVTVGPSVLDPDSPEQDYSLVGHYNHICLHYNGEPIYLFPHPYEWIVDEHKTRGKTSLCNIWACLDTAQAETGVISPAIQYLFDARMTVSPRIPEGATEPIFNEVQVMLYARHNGAAANAFSISASGMSVSKDVHIPPTYVKTKDIPETGLTGGGGLQESVCAIGVLRAKDVDTGEYRLLKVGDTSGFNMVFSAGSYIKAYMGTELVVDHSMPTGSKMFDELCEYIASLLEPIMPVEVYKVAQGTWNGGASDLSGTLHCKAVNAGAAGNNLRIEIYTGNPTYDYGYAKYFKIDMFGGVDGVDPGTDTTTDTDTDTRSVSISTSTSEPPVVHPLTPQQIANLISTLPDYTAVVHEEGSNLVDITAKRAGARYNADTYSIGGVEVVKQVSDGTDKRDIGGLAKLIREFDYFDLYANPIYAGVIELTARQAGAYVNDRPIECTGCFGDGTVLMGSKTEGASGVDPTRYNLVLNGKYITQGGDVFRDADNVFTGNNTFASGLYIGDPGYDSREVGRLTNYGGSLYWGGTKLNGGGGGGVDVEQVPVSGHTDVAVSSDGVYNVTHVTVESVELVTETAETSGTNLHSAYPSERYACIGSNVFGTARGKLTAVRMQAWTSAGGFNNVQLLVSYDPEFTEGVHWSSNALSPGHSGGMCDWVFDDPIEITGAPLYLRWWGPTYQFAQTWLYCMMYDKDESDESYVVRSGGAHIDAVPYCVFTIETGGRTVTTDSWAGPEVEGHIADQDIHVKPGMSQEHAALMAMHSRSTSFVTEASDNGNYKWLILNREHVVDGVLSKVRIAHRRNGTAAGNEAYLAVFQMPEGGSPSDPSGWDFKGVSTNTVLDNRLGTGDNEWLFDGAGIVSGRPVAFTFRPSRESAGTWDEATAVGFGVSVGAVPDGDTETRMSGTTGASWAPAHVGLSFITSDGGGGGVTAVDVVETGNMNAVTSNATALALAGKEDTIPYVERTLLDIIGTGSLWPPGTYGSVSLAGDDFDGIAMQNKAFTARIELTGGGSAAITATSTPKWIDAGDLDNPGLYDIVTTKAFDPSTVPALSSRVTAVEGDVAALEANTHSMRTATFADKAGEVQVVAYFGETTADFYGVCFPNGFNMADKTWYMMPWTEFAAVATTSGTVKTITSVEGYSVAYDSAATGTSRVFNMPVAYNGAQGSVDANWGKYTTMGLVTVTSLAPYALPATQEVAMARMALLVSNASDRRTDRLDRVVSNLGNGLLQLSEDDIYFALPSNNGAAYSLSNGTLSMSGGGSYSAVMLHKAARHFEATTTAGQSIAVMVASKPGDPTGGAGVVLAGALDLDVCSKGDYALVADSTIQGYTKLSTVSGDLPAGKITVDVLDMSSSPQASTGYTRRVVVKVGDAKVLDTYIDGGLGSKTGYTEPRIGVFGSWNNKGRWTLTDCKVSYGQQLFLSSNAE